MKNIKKFNEHSEEMPAGYTPNTGRGATPKQFVPITMDMIKESIIEVMMDYSDEVDVKDPKFAEGINSLAEKIMGNFQDELSYITENYEDDIQDILSLDENY
jgi:hypothetical protein